MAFPDHLPVDVPAIQVNPPEQPSVMVLPLGCDQHLATEQLARQCLSRSRAPRLAPFRRVDFGQPQTHLGGTAVALDEQPDRVSIRYAHHLGIQAGKRSAKLAGVGFLNAAKQKGEPGAEQGNRTFQSGRFPTSLVGNILHQLSLNRSINSAKLQGRWLLSSCFAMIFSQPVRTALPAPGRAKIRVPLASPPKARD